MELEDGRLVCRLGDMDLSQHAQDGLVSVVRSGPLEVAPSRVRWGGSWYCPADGSRMREAGGRVVCPGCSRVLPGGLLYELIEFHVHRRRV